MRRTERDRLIARACEQSLRAGIKVKPVEPLNRPTPVETIIPVETRKNRPGKKAELPVKSSVHAVIVPPEKPKQARGQVCGNCFWHTTWFSCEITNEFKDTNAKCDCNSFIDREEAEYRLA